MGGGCRMFEVVGGRGRFVSIASQVGDDALRV